MVFDLTYHFVIKLWILSRDFPTVFAQRYRVVLSNRKSVLDAIFEKSEVEKSVIAEGKMSETRPSTARQLEVGKSHKAIVTLVIK